MSSDPINALVNAALNGRLIADDHTNEHRPELSHVYGALYNAPVIVEDVTGEAHQPTMTTAIRIANALADAGLLRDERQPE